MRNLIEQFGETMLVFLLCSGIVGLFVYILLMVTQVV